MQEGLSPLQFNCARCVAAGRDGVKCKATAAGLCSITVCNEEKKQESQKKKAEAKAKADKAAETPTPKAAQTTKPTTPIPFAVETGWLPKSTPADLVYLYFKEKSDLMQMEEQVKNLKIKIKKSKEALQWIEDSANEWYDDEVAELEEQTTPRVCSSSKSKSTPESASSLGSGAARGTHTKF